MPNIINNWPYTDLHNLNLDWIIRTVKEMGEKLESFETYFPHVSEHDNGVWDPAWNYDPNEIVYTTDAVYIAKTSVPTGIAITNTAYWLPIATIGIDILNIDSRLTAAEADIDALENNQYYVTPEEYGAAGDGTTDDTAAIQAAIDNANGKPVMLSKKYKISSPIHVYSNCTPDFNMNGATIISGAAMTYMIIAGENGDGGGTWFRSQRIHGGVLRVTGANASGILISEEINNCIVEDIVMFDVSKYGVHAEAVTDGENTRKHSIHNVAVNGITETGSDTTSVAFKLDTWDMILTNIESYWNAIGVESVGGEIITNFHSWVPRTSFTTKAKYEDTIAVKTFRGQISNLYADAACAIYLTGDHLNATNIHQEVNPTAIGDTYADYYMIKAYNDNADISLSDYYWTHEGLSEGNGNVFLNTIYVPDNIYYNYCDAQKIHITGLACTQSKVDQARNLVVSPIKEVNWWVHPQDNDPWNTSRGYRIGYISAIGNLYERFDLTICKGNTAVDVSFATQNGVVTVNSESVTPNIGTLLIGPVETVLGKSVQSLWLKPESTDVDWTNFTFKLNFATGAAALYVEHQEDANGVYYKYAPNIGYVGEVKA